MLSFPVVFSLLVLPSGLALLYDVSAWAFNAMWFEYTGVSEVCISWRQPLRWILFAATLSVALGDSLRVKTTDVLIYILSAVSLVISVYLMRETRQTIVEGGPAPPTLLMLKKGSPLLLPQEKRVMIVTGANTGIGLETARQLAQFPNTAVVLCCRSLAKAEAARRDILSTAHSKATVACQALDLSSLESVKAAARELINKYPQIHVLIHNAGLMHKDCLETVDHLELTLQVNCLAPFLLTHLLQPALQNGARILNVVSSTYVLAKGQTEQLLTYHQTKPYTMFGQYARSKLAAIYLTHEWQTLQTSNNSKNYHVAAVHPGLVRTDVVRNMPWYLRYPNVAFASVLACLQKTPTQGAWCTVHLATCPDATLWKTTEPSSSLYWVNRKPQPLHPQAQASLAEHAPQVWKHALKLVGLSDHINNSSNGDAQKVGVRSKRE